MAWVVKLSGGQKSNNSSKAVLSKYGKKLSASIYSFDKHVFLQSAISELKYIENNGIEIEYEVLDTKAEEFVIC